MVPGQPGSPLVISGDSGTFPPDRVKGNKEKCSIAAAGWGAAVVILPAVTIVVLGYFKRYLCDDGLIYSRAVRQILAGNGPVFNIGERAESSTSALWQWFLVLVGWTTRMDVGPIAVFSGLLLTGLGVAVALDGTRRFYQPPDSSMSEFGASGSRSGHFFLLPAGIVLLLATPPAWDYATSGLESGLQSFWLATCWWLLVRSRLQLRPRALALISTVIGLGPLVRPELGIVTIIFLVAVLINVGPNWKGVLLNVCAAGALPFVYEIFRAGYYGLLVPLPALAKEASLMNWPRGAAYVKDFMEPYWLIVPVVAVDFLIAAVTRLIGRERSWRQSTKDLYVIAGPVLSGLVLGTYVIAVGGDYLKPDDSANTAAQTSSPSNWQPAKTPPHGYRSSVAYDPTQKFWITVGPNGTDISRDDGKNWTPLTPSGYDPPDADKNWNALSLPFVVGPNGRIGRLRTIPNPTK